jgi:S1-C subfamily serine protease
MRRPRIASRASTAWAADVIVSSDGHVLTNAHVVDGADKVRVLLHDGREFDGKVIGVDKASDLAVLDIKATSLPIVRSPTRTRRASVTSSSPSETRSAWARR